MRRFIWVLAIFPMQAGAQEFVVLTGAQIGATLTGHAMVYEDGATQDFHASGRTLYNAGRDSGGVGPCGAINIAASGRLQRGGIVMTSHGMAT